MKLWLKLLLSPALFWVPAAATAQTVDVEAAIALVKRNDCFKCHAIDKTKKGPAYRRIAGRLASKPDAAEVIVEHVSSGPMIQFDDGTSERHKIVDTRDRNELENLARWLLSLATAPPRD